MLSASISCLIRRFPHLQRRVEADPISDNPLTAKRGPPTCRETTAVISPVSRVPSPSPTQTRPVSHWLWNGSPAQPPTAASRQRRLIAIAIGSARMKTLSGTKRYLLPTRKMVSFSSRAWFAKLHCTLCSNCRDIQMHTVSIIHSVQCEQLIWNYHFRLNPTDVLYAALRNAAQHICVAISFIEFDSLFKRIYPAPYAINNEHPYSVT